MDETHNAQPPSVSEECSEDLPTTHSLKNKSRPNHIRDDANSMSQSDGKKGMAETVGRKRKRDAGRGQWRYGLVP
jgi:hypothetical protein